MPFSLPTDCREIIYGRDSFAFPGWQRAWSTTLMFRVSGLTDALVPIGIRRDQIQSIDIVKQSIYSRVPGEWREFFGPSTGAQGAWGPLGDPQIDKHIQKSLPQILDRALLSIVYVITFIEDVCRKEVPADFFDHVCIMPIPYSVMVEPRDFWEQNVAGRPLAGDLAQAVAPCPEFLVTEALRDHKRLTYRNAEKIRDALVVAGHHAQIVCSPEGRPNAAEKEVLTESRKVAHPAITQFIRAAA